MHDYNELTCTRCGKLCAKASSLKRHHYYCRSKPLGQRKSRKRCCEACTGSKIRCDATFPSCSSCASRKIACQYADHALPNLAYSSNDRDSPIAPQAHMNNNLALIDTSNPFALYAESDLQSKFDFNIFTPVGLESNVDAPITSEPSGFSLDLADLGSENISVFPAEHINSRAVSPISLQWKPPKVMDRRAVDTPRAQMANMMLAQIIASFPHMMTSTETFPPFIHPRCYDYASGSNELSEILKDCMGLAHMFHTKKRESEKVFWRSVRMEQERLFAQYETYSNYELLAASQAILVYITMRLIDGKSGDSEVEIPLLHSLNIIVSHLCRQLGRTEYRICMEHGDRHWQEWIFSESQRRLVTMAQIMNIAFDMDRAFSCSGIEGFSLLPLPAKKVAWETKDEHVWNAEYDKFRSKGLIHGLTSEGRLVSLRQTTKGIARREEGWQKWLANQDGFGILVLLASQLLG